MKLAINRDPSYRGATMGELITEDAAGNKRSHIGYTLEDVEREDGDFVLGETCLPKGLYWVRVTHSPRFKREMVLITDTETGYTVVTPAHTFTGLRFHGGNDAADTETCVLLGRVAIKADCRIHTCRGVNNQLVKLVKAHGPMRLEIR